MGIFHQHCPLMTGRQGRRKICHYQTFSDGARRLSSRQEQRVEVHAEQEISRRRSRQHVGQHAEQEISRRKSRLRAGQHVEHQTSRVPKIIKRYIRIDKQYQAGCSGISWVNQVACREINFKNCFDGRWEITYVNFSSPHCGRLFRKGDCDESVLSGKVIFFFSVAYHG